MRKLFPILPVLDKVWSIAAVDFSWTLLVWSQHILNTTGSLLEKLIELWLCAENIFLTGKIYSCNIEILWELKTIWVQIIDPTYTNESTCWNGFYEYYIESIRNLWSKVLDRIHTDSSVKKIIILDDGGYCIANIPSSLVWKEIIITWIEQTTNGLDKIPHNIPVITVANSAVKKYLESDMIADAVFAQMKNRFYELDLFGKWIRFGVIWFGNIWRAICSYLQEQWEYVRVFDKKIIEDANEFPVRSLDSLMQDCDVIFWCTGFDIFSDRLDILDTIQSDKTFISCSSSDIEFFSLISWAWNYDSSFHPMNTVFLIWNSHTIRVIGWWYPINFDPSLRYSVPDEKIQLTRWLLLVGVIQAINHTKTLTWKVPLDAWLQKFVADTYLDIYASKRNNFLSDIEWIWYNS